MSTVGFLGYDRSETALIDALETAGHIVTPIAGPTADLGASDVNVSFGYRHILPAAVLETSQRPVLNLHIGYLPYNRGAHPNFWAIVDNTPSGVTIHEMDAGIDTGPVCFQRYVNFAGDETTLAQTHARLLREVEALFMEHMDDLIAGRYAARPQRGFGTMHRAADLPAFVDDWNLATDVVREKLDPTAKIRSDLAIIDEIQNVRTRNNVNWMDLLRVAVKSSPAETKKIIQKINNDDNKISDLFRILGG